MNVSNSRRRPASLYARLTDDLPLDISGAGSRALVLMLMAVMGAGRGDTPRATDELLIAHRTRAPVVVVNGFDFSAAQDHRACLSMTVVLAKPGWRRALLSPGRAARDDTTAEILFKFGGGASRDGGGVEVALLELVHTRGP